MKEITFYDKDKNNKVEFEFGNEINIDVKGKSRTIKFSSAVKYDEKHPAYIAAMKLKEEMEILMKEKKDQSEMISYKQISC